MQNTMAAFVCKQGATPSCLLWMHKSCAALALPSRYTTTKRLIMAHSFYIGVPRILLIAQTELEMPGCLRRNHEMISVSRQKDLLCLLVPCWSARHLEDDESTKEEILPMLHAWMPHNKVCEIAWPCCSYASPLMHVPTPEPWLSTQYTDLWVEHFVY